MARQVYRFAITVAAGTPLTGPQSTDLDLPSLTVEEVRLRFPPGPSGLVGVQLAISHQQVIPYGMGQWVVANDESIPYPLKDFPDTGDWSLIAYNTGAYPHTVQAEFLLVLPDLGAVPPLSLIPTTALEGM